MAQDTQAGTDRSAELEQARQAMLRAQTASDGSTDAPVEDDDTDEVAATDADAVEDTDEDEEDAADDADESEDESDGDDDAHAEDDGDDADDEEAAPNVTKGKRRKAGKVAKLHNEIKSLKAQLADRDKDVDARIDAALASKRESEAELAAIKADQVERDKRRRQVRGYMQELRGTDEQLDRLTRKMATTKRPDPLDREASEAYENEQARLAQMLSVRDLTDIAIEYADDDLRDQVTAILVGFEKLDGVQKGFHQLDFKPAVQHLYDAGLAHGRSEQTAEIKKLTKQVADLEGKLSSAKLKRGSPVRQVPEGGASVAKPAAKAKRPEDMTPQERAAAMGMFNPDGSINADFRTRKNRGLVSLIPA